MPSRITFPRKFLQRTRKLLRMHDSTSPRLRTEDDGAGNQRMIPPALVREHAKLTASVQANKGARKKMRKTGSDGNQGPPGAQRDSSRTGNEPKYGMQTLYEPNDPAKAVVDIIFIHGLTGSADDTWLHTKSGKHWPRMMLKDNISDARILSFGYDADVANWWSQTSINGISSHAENMLGAAVRLRENTQSEDRKIVFVAHSLGGLVTEKTMALSRHSPFEHMRQIEKHTIGVIFLGTPHFGADAAKWGTYGGHLISIVRQTNVPIIEVLKPDSETLASIQKDFQGVLRQRIDERTPIDVTCFYEELPVRFIGLIVPRESALLHPYNGYGIHANHMDMTKFSNPADSGYDDIVGEILRPIRRIRGVSQPISTVQEECLQSLSFEILTARQENIDFPIADTYKWILSSDSGFKKWLKSGRDIYWIWGKPGSGKSTLMKYLAESSQIPEILRGPLGPMRTGTPVIAAHFLDFKGQDPLARSMEGLLRSLLWQILKINPSSFEQVLPQYTDMKRTRVGVVWSRHILTNLLKSVLQQILSRPVCIFIDALDEYLESDTEEHEDRHIAIATFFDNLAEALPKNIRFCLSSRPYPKFAIQHLYTSQLRLHHHTSGDIRLYVKLRFEPITQGLDVMLRKYRNVVDRIINSIITKAEGVFLWVKLVCDALLRGWRKAESIAKLEQHLREMPEKLSSLYQRILEELSPIDSIEVLLMLGIVASATRPFSLAELSYTLQNAHYPSTDDLRRRIDAICGGFLEVKFGKVRLCHETVLAYLHNHQAQALLDGNRHILLACIGTLSTIEKTGTGSIEWKETHYSRYSILNWFNHASKDRGYTGNLRSHAWQRLSNKQFLLWYELFLCISWELPSIHTALSYEFSIARLQQILLFYNVNLALTVHTLPLKVETESTTGNFGHSTERFIVDTGTGICFLASTSPFEICGQERLSCFLEVDGQSFSSLQRTLDTSDTNLAETLVSRELDPAYLPDQFNSTDVDPNRRRADRVVFLPARHSEALRFLNEIEIHSAWRAKGITPLQLAAYHGLEGVLDILLLNQANINLEAGTLFGTSLMASICGIAELPHPTYARSEPVFLCFDMLLARGANPNQAGFGTEIGGLKTPLEVSLWALLSRIRAIESFGNRVNVLEDIRCGNMIYVINHLLDSGAQPNLEAQQEVKKSPQVWLLFEEKISFILKSGKESVDDTAVKPPKPRQRLELSLPRRYSGTMIGTSSERPYGINYEAVGSVSS